MDSGAVRDRATLSQERFLEKITAIVIFLDGLEYSTQFKDERMLDMVDVRGAGFWQLAQIASAGSVT